MTTQLLDKQKPNIIIASRKSQVAMNKKQKTKSNNNYNIKFNIMNKDKIKSNNNIYYLLLIFKY